ncbi:hypothetical protein OJAV_G00075830 [Oryzias javanicus]|uniref:Uncharacterized protein n=1 Tax=Oryzias javanicus TaxID=123683 RepID=A0A3S2MXT9_ORYJA|nr:hypothetical protein OJAV_G00075830 [Oryzias javanicus]
MAGVNGDRKGKKDDNGIGTAIDFMLSNAKLVLGVGGAAMLGIATLAVKRMYDRAISAPTSPTKMQQGGKRSWEEPAWMGSSPRVLNHDMKSTVSRSLQTLPTSSHACEPGEGEDGITVTVSTFHASKSQSGVLLFLFNLLTDGFLGGILLFLYSGCWSLLEHPVAF